MEEEDWLEKVWGESAAEIDWELKNLPTPTNTDGE